MGIFEGMLHMNSFEFFRGEILEKLESANQTFGNMGFEERIQSARARIERENMQLLVVGEFSRGKSTFINALLSAPVLPSKVNPTTAAITIINGKPNRTMKIRYQDDTQEEAQLPETRVNRFLEEYITTVNNQANRIKTVEISWPSPISAWNVSIVDTPGVNDLDELREEVTYQYLSQADACLVILDSQQPLSESERRFLKDKVLANDINRMLFVINRLDEAADEPYGETAKRLMRYVEKLIGENLPSIGNPEIYAVSAKEALKCRHMKEDNLWNDAFAKFEEKMVTFIAHNATKGRIPNHVERLAGILEDGITVIENKQASLALSGEELQQHINKLEIEEERLGIQLNAFVVMCEKEAIKLSSDIKNNTWEVLEKLKNEMIAEAQQCSCDEDLVLLKSSLNRGLRKTIEVIEKTVCNFRSELSEKVSKEFPALSRETGRDLTTYQIDRANKLDGSMELATFSNEYASDDAGNVVGTLMVSGVIGYAAGYLFGPLGIVAAAVGIEKITSFFEKDKQQKEWERIRKQTIHAICNQIDLIVSNAELKSQDIAKKEVDMIKKKFAEIAEAKHNILRQQIVDQKEQVVAQKRNVTMDQNSLKESIEKTKELLNETYGMRRRVDGWN